MSAVKKSISMPDALWSSLEKRAVDLGYATTSAYFQQLVREDLLRQGNHVRGLNASALRDSAAPSLNIAASGSPVSYGKSAREAAGKTLAKRAKQLAAKVTVQK